MKRKNKIKLALVFLMSVLQTTLYAATPQERLEEIDYIEKIMSTSWGNLEIHKKQDGVDVKKIVDRLKKWTNASDEDYLAALFETVELFRDSHVGIVLPKGVETRNDHSGLHIVPVREGYALVKCESPADCSDLTLPLLVMKVDGLPAETWVRQRAAKLGESTEAGRRKRAITNLGWYRYLKKNTQPARRITLLLPNGKTKTLRLNWQKYVWWNREAGEPEPRCVKGKQHPSGTFILTIESFDCGLSQDKSIEKGYRRFLKNMKEALNEAKGADSLMIDVRENGGGHHKNAWIALKLLIDKETLFLTELFLNEDGTWDGPDQLIISPEKKWRKYFKGRQAAILSGAGCGSICSYLLVAAKTAGVVMTLGEPAEGSNGNAKHYKLPASGALLGIPENKSWTADGQPMEGRIIDVDKKVVPSVNDYKSDTDPVLTKAIKIFRRERL